MRKVIMGGLTAAVLLLAACTPTPEDSAKPVPTTPSPRPSVDDPALGLDIRYVDRDGNAKVLRVEDFPR